MPIELFERYLNSLAYPTYDGVIDRALNWREISSDEGIPVEFFERYLDNVVWWKLSTNEGIPVEFFERHLDKVNWRYLSSNASIPLWFFEKHFNMINWVGLSYNEGIPLWFFEKHIDKVSWLKLSRNANFIKQLKMKELQCALQRSSRATVWPFPTAVGSRSGLREVCNKSSATSYQKASVRRWEN